jgi:hypothetical protein
MEMDNVDDIGTCLTLQPVHHPVGAAERTRRGTSATARPLLPKSFHLQARSYHANIGIRGSPSSTSPDIPRTHGPPQRLVSLGHQATTLRRLTRCRAAKQLPFSHHPHEAEAELGPFMVFSPWPPWRWMNHAALTNANDFLTSISIQTFSFSTSLLSFSPSVMATSPTKSLSTFGHQ